MVLSMAVTSKLGISRGTAEEDGLVWAEQSTAVSNIEKTQRMRVVILALSCELSPRNLPLVRPSPYPEFPFWLRKQQHSKPISLVRATLRNDFSSEHSRRSDRKSTRLNSSH